jgi:hypothetical protein
MVKNGWKIPKMDDDWGYPYDLGNHHIRDIILNFMGCHGILWDINK